MLEGRPPLTIMQTRRTNARLGIRVVIRWGCRTASPMMSRGSQRFRRLISREPRDPPWAFALGPKPTAEKETGWRF